MIGIGIDTGGTCTDAVVYDYEDGRVLGYGKALTTREHLETGIAAALDQLPEELMRQAQRVALSTTLATNACLENKGARAKLLLIGFDRGMMEHLRALYASYGLDDLTRFVVLDARAEGAYAHPYDPDWEELRRRAPEWFEDCDSVGIVQMNPRSNGGRFERTAMRILRETLPKPVTVAFEISRETDILKTVAGTMLNARLIPLISDFMKAVHHVLEQRGLRVPVSIVRSDGTLMPEEMASSCPVETILCGPSASVVGGAALAGAMQGAALAGTMQGAALQEKEDRGGMDHAPGMSAVIVDMGGTTTDIALVRDAQPLMAEEGIAIGQWKTMVKGLYVETVGLGGDSAVRYTKNGELYLDTVRVMPVSMLAAQYTHVLPCLEELAGRRYISSNPVHEFYILLKDIRAEKGYSETEQRICEILREKPLITMELAERMGCYHRFLHTEKLERDGVILKSGLTPTDLMILKGDFVVPDTTRRDGAGSEDSGSVQTIFGADPGAAARAALRCVCANTGISEEELPNRVYEMVIRRMYHSIGRVLLQKEYPKRTETFTAEYLSPLLDCFYEQAKKQSPDAKQAGKPSSYPKQAGKPSSDPIQAEKQCSYPEPEENRRQNFADLRLTCPLPLVGVGAPIHVFLPKVAALLGTRALIPSHARVANALGAAAAARAVHCELLIKAEYRGAEFVCLSMYEDGVRHTFEEPGEAAAFGRRSMERMLRAEAGRRGMEEPLRLDIRTEENRIGHQPKGILLEIRVSGSCVPKAK